jgi:hypothetical protein
MTIWNVLVILVVGLAEGALLFRIWLRSMLLTKREREIEQRVMQAEAALTLIGYSDKDVPKNVASLIISGGELHSWTLGAMRVSVAAERRCRLHIRLKELDL